MRETLYMGLSIWLGIIGAFIGLFGTAVEFIGSLFRRFGKAIVEYSFKYDNL